MRGFSTEAKVGLAVIAASLILAFMSVKIGLFRIGKEPGYRVFVIFDSASGLDKKSTVKMAGVDIGKVESMELTDGKAKVWLRIDPEIVLRKGAVAVIRSAGLLGEKFVEILPGKEKGLISEGGSIPQSDVVGDLETLIAKFSEIGTDIKAVTRSLREAVGSKQGEEDLKAILANFHKFSEHLDQLITDNRESVGDIVENLRDFSDFLNTVAADMEAGRGTVGKLLKDDALYNKLTGAVTDVQKIAAKIESGEGTIGKLVSDDKAYQKINNALDGLSNTLGRIERFKTSVGFRNEYQFDTTHANKGYFSVTLAPRADKYYLLEVVDDPAGYYDNSTQTITTGGSSVTTTTITSERKLKLSLEMGRRYNNLDLHLGLVENSFGAGAAVLFLNDKLRIGADIWDFNSPDPSSPNPHLKTTVSYSLIHNFYIQGGIDQMINSNIKTGFAGAGLVLDDEDIKYLLGSMGGAIR